MNVVELGRDRGTGQEQLWFTCPGCKQSHRIPVVRDGKSQSAWSWNGSLDKPTCSPSLKTSWTQGEDRVKHVCHFFIREGRLEFCGDCTHELAGRKVAMEPVA